MPLIHRQFRRRRFNARWPAMTAAMQSFGTRIGRRWRRRRPVFPGMLRRARRVFRRARRMDPRDVFVRALRAAERIRRIRRGNLRRLHPFGRGVRNPVARAVLHGRVNDMFETAQLGQNSGWDDYAAEYERNRERQSLYDDSFAGFGVDNAW